MIETRSIVRSYQTGYTDNGIARRDHLGLSKVRRRATMEVVYPMPRTRTARKRYHLLPNERLGPYQEPTTPDIEQGIRKLVAATVLLALQDAAVENPPYRMADAYGWLQGKGKSWLQHLDIEYDNLDSAIERVRSREVYGIFPSHVKSQE